MRRAVRAAEVTYEMEDLCSLACHGAVGLREEFLRAAIGY